MALDVVIVTYECRALVLRCLESLHAHAPGVPLTITVVDNDSQDGTADAVAATHPDVDLVRLPTNSGFAHANNVGIRRHDAPFVLVLNPDTEITPGSLEVLLSVLAQEERVAVAGPRLVLPDGSFDHASRRSFPTIGGAIGHFTGLGRRAGAPAALAQYRAPAVERGVVDAVNGAFMLTRRDALEAVGLFDERYWLYMEDLDLCYRLRAAGWLTWYEPSVEVVHVKAGSSGRLRRPRANIAFHRGMARFYRSHYAPASNALVNGVVYAGIASKLAWSLARTAVARRFAS